LGEDGQIVEIDGGLPIDLVVVDVGTEQCDGGLLFLAKALECFADLEIVFVTVGTCEVLRGVGEIAVGTVKEKVVRGMDGSGALGQPLVGPNMLIGVLVFLYEKPSAEEALLVLFVADGTGDGLVYER
jgi:hypothetical protein